MQSVDPTAIEAEIDLIRSLGLDALRTRWRTIFGFMPPPALTKDLIARMIAYRLQEEAYGGLDRATAKLLDAYANGDKARTELMRRLKPGAVLVREYRGERHTVTVVPDGFVWQPLNHCPRHYRHSLERPPLLRPADSEWRSGRSRAGKAHGARSCRSAAQTSSCGGPDMNAPAKKLFRCAIYTRKSTEHNLDLEFNSLDAQREACEAYIKSQAHEGWSLIHSHYDDGAVSGASLDRPALQRLLTEVRSGKIDIIVVYKVDRLTRSLADFAKLVELFDQHSVSFVSVTQSFNTTSSMGRLTLNVLLSFAQFEREVIGERVRDKIAASKRKGIWVGGIVPLGYASINKKLMVVPDEASTVRLIFQRYLELGSVRALAQDLDQRGIRTKRRVLATGQAIGGIRFGVGALAHLLKNRFYIGEVVYRGGTHSGEHESILDRDLFEAVQAKLNENAVERQLRLKASPALLTGRIFDDRGNRMTPTHTNKLGVRYRYYVSHALQQKRKHDAGSVSRVPAPEIETVVLKALHERFGADDGRQSTFAGDRDLIEHQLERVVVKARAIEIYIAEKPESPEGMSTGTASNCEARDPTPTTVTVPWSTATLAEVKGILHSPSERATMRLEMRDVLLGAIAKARMWIDELVQGRVGSFSEIAMREGKVERHIRLLTPLAFVSPRIISAIMAGSAPTDLTVTGLAQPLAHSWTEQERRTRPQTHEN
jgi:site-specific DNA recombinase